MRNFARMVAAIHFWNMVISPFRDKNGSTQGVTIVLDDLTELRQRMKSNWLRPGVISRQRWSVTCVRIDVDGVVGEERSD